MIDIRPLLRDLPHHQHADHGWCQAENQYPIYTKIAQALRPKRVLEIGTLLGYSLIALLAGGPSIRLTVSIDTEEYLADSQIKARENVRAYLDRHWPGRHVTTVFSRERRVLSDLMGFDLVHVDGDHSYGGCRADLDAALQMGPKWIIVDDVEHLPAVRQAVDAWSEEQGITYQCVASFRGLAYFDFTHQRRYHLDQMAAKGVPFVAGFGGASDGIVN